MTSSTLTLHTAAAAGRIVGRCGAESIVAGRTDEAYLRRIEKGETP